MSSSVKDYMQQFGVQLEDHPPDLSVTPANPGRFYADCPVDRNPEAYLDLLLNNNNAWPEAHKEEKSQICYPVSDLPAGSIEPDYLTIQHSYQRNGSPSATEQRTIEAESHPKRKNVDKQKRSKSTCMSCEKPKTDDDSVEYMTSQKDDVSHLNKSLYLCGIQRHKKKKNRSNKRRTCQSEDLNTINNDKHILNVNNKNDIKSKKHVEHSPSGNLEIHGHGGGVDLKEFEIIESDVTQSSCEPHVHESNAVSRPCLDSNEMTSFRLSLPKMVEVIERAQRQLEQSRASRLKAKLDTDGSSENDNYSSPRVKKTTSHCEERCCEEMCSSRKWPQSVAEITRVESKHENEDIVNIRKKNSMNSVNRGWWNKNNSLSIDHGSSSVIDEKCRKNIDTFSTKFDSPLLKISEYSVRGEEENDCKPLNLDRQKDSYVNSSSFHAISFNNENAENKQIDPSINRTRKQVKEMSPDGLGNAQQSSSGIAANPSPPPDVVSTTLGAFRKKELLPHLLAAKRGDLTALKLELSDESACELVKHRDTFGNSVLHLSCEGGHVDCVVYLYTRFEYLLTQGNNVKLTPAALAIKNGQIEVLDWLLQNANLGKEVLTPVGRRPLLHQAAKHGQDGCLRLMLQKLKNEGENFQKCFDQHGNTPGHLAAKYGHLTSLQTLVEYEIDVTLANKYGYTPCYYADFGNHRQCVGYLMVVTTCVKLAEELISLSRKHSKWKKENQVCKEDESSTDRCSDDLETKISDGCQDNHASWSLVTRRFEEAARGLVVYRTSVQHPSVFSAPSSISSTSMVSATCRAPEREQTTKPVMSDSTALCRTEAQPLDKTVNKAIVKDITGSEPCNKLVGVTEHIDSKTNEFVKKKNSGQFDRDQENVWHTRDQTVLDNSDQTIRPLIENESGKATTEGDQIKPNGSEVSIQRGILRPASGETEKNLQSSIFPIDVKCGRSKRDLTGRPSPENETQTSALTSKVNYTKRKSRKLEAEISQLEKDLKRFMAERDSQRNKLAINTEKTVPFPDSNCGGTRHAEFMSSKETWKQALKEQFLLDRRVKKKRPSKDEAFSDLNPTKLSSMNKPDSYFISSKQKDGQNPVMQSVKVRRHKRILPQKIKLSDVEFRETYERRVIIDTESNDCGDNDTVHSTPSFDNDTVHSTPSFDTHCDTEQSSVNGELTDHHGNNEERKKIADSSEIGEEEVLAESLLGDSRSSKAWYDEDTEDDAVVQIPPTENSHRTDFAVF